MKTVTETKPFNKRILTSLVLALAGLIMPVSGMILHSQPPALMNIGRHFWMVVHNSAAFLFVAAMAVHITTHRSALMHYIKGMHTTLMSKEALWALTIVFGLISLAALHVFLK